jgi:diguanylate cyclase (GGDEF)-like protein
MEKIDSDNLNNSYQERKLMSFVDGLPKRKDLREANHKYKEREEYWSGLVKELREKVNKRKLTEENFDKTIGNLIAFKEFSSAYDALTGLPNRRAFNKNLKREIAQARRLKTSLSLLVIDIDDMKSFNDDGGHSIGDMAIENTAETLISVTRDGDFVARWAGDEFAVILPQTEGIGAFSIAKRILGRIKKFPALTPSGKKLSVSIGIKQWQGENNDDFFKKTDNLLYEAKESPNKIAIFR